MPIFSHATLGVRPDSLPQLPSRERQATVQGTAISYHCLALTAASLRLELLFGRYPRDPAPKFLLWHLPDFCFSGVFYGYTEHFTMQRKTE